MAVLRCPIAAFLVESFPAKIRYTSVSLPYHFGNRYLGGWLPFIVGTIFVKETNHISIHEETQEAYPIPA